MQVMYFQWQTDGPYNLTKKLKRPYVQMMHTLYISLKLRDKDVINIQQKLETIDDDQTT